jgi:hypothetical protein
MYKAAYLSLKEKYESLVENNKILKSRLGKAFNHQQSLESEVKLQKIILKRICRESSIEGKG